MHAMPWRRCGIDRARAVASSFLRPRKAFTYTIRLRIGCRRKFDILASAAAALELLCSVNIFPLAEHLHAKKIGARMQIDVIHHAAQAQCDIANVLKADVWPQAGLS